MPRGWCACIFDMLCPFLRNWRKGLGVNRSPSLSARGSAIHDVTLNMILHGECGVGKTSLRNRWVDGLFTGDVAPTFGVDFNIKTLDLVYEEEEQAEGERGKGTRKDGEAWGAEGGAAERERIRRLPYAEVQVKINVYDTSGKPGYREVNSTYLLAFDAVLFVYDVTAMSTLDELQRYFSDPEHRDRLTARKEAGTAMLLVANKSDAPLSERQVGSQTGEDAAAKFGIPFKEVSAKSGANVKEAFMFLATEAVGEHLAREQLGPTGRRRAGGKRSMRKITALQRVRRARVSVLDLFKGISTRHKYIQKQQDVMLSSLPETSSQTAASHRDRIDGDERQPLQQPPPPPQPPEEGASAESEAPVNRSWLQGPWSRPFQPLNSPAQSEARDSPKSRASLSPTEQSGTGITPTSALLEKPEVSPVSSTCSKKAASPTSRGQSPPSNNAAELRGHSRRGDSFGGGGAADQYSEAAATLTLSPSLFSAGQNTRGRGGSASPRSGSASPTLSGGHVSPRTQMNPDGVDPAAMPWAATLMNARGRSPGGSPRGGGGQGARAGVTGSSRFPSAADGRKSQGASPENDGGAADTAATRLREASSFWLDQWGIKADKTNAARGRRMRTRGSPPQPQKGKGNLQRHARPTNPG